jgi:hypothetical protein
MIARSLSEAFLHRATATQLLLAYSPDVACVNLMCEHVGGGCACRVSLSLERMALLEEVDLRGNRLPQLPESLFTLPRLRVVRASGNALQALPRSLGARCSALEALDIGDNALRDLPLAALAALPSLRRLRVAGNPLTEQALEGIHGNPALRRAVEEGAAGHW